MPPVRQARGGTPGPDRWIHHESINTAAKGIDGVEALFAGATCVNGVPMSALVTCAGASRARVRFKATAAGELKLEFVRPAENNWKIEPYASGNPLPVTIVANAENLLTSTDLAGEASALITFTPTGAGTVNFCDFMAI